MAAGKWSRTTPSKSFTMLSKLDMQVAFSHETCRHMLIYFALQRLFDGACDYGNEKEIGRGIARAIKEGLVKREELFSKRQATEVPTVFCTRSVSLLIILFSKSSLNFGTPTMARITSARPLKNNSRISVSNTLIYILFIVSIKVRTR